MTITVSGLTKSFAGQTVVDDVSFALAPGDFFVVLGPSGCGKTTLLRMIAGLERSDAGTISLDGREVFGPRTDVPPERRNVGVVFQSYALWPHMDVAGNVDFPTAHRGLTRGERAEAVAEALTAVDLDGFASRRPAELSGGQRQRVALARCLAQAATTILMDEPLANLDPHLRADLERELATFHARTGATTLFITHDQREAMALATRMAVMWQGRLLQIGSAEEVHDRPADARVAGFVGRSVILSADLPADCKEGPCGAARMMVRPQDVVVAADGLSVTVSDATYRGGFHEVRAVTDGGDELLLDLSRRPEPGERLGVRITRGWLLV